MDSSARTLLAAITSNYHTRILVCVAVSLALCILLVRSPLYPPAKLVGWQVADEMPDPILTMIDVQEQAENTPVYTAGVQRDDVNTEAETDPELDSEAEEPEPEPASDEEEEVAGPDQTLTMVYEDVQEMPEIEGGMTSYYLNIEYPRAALIAGIQGSLLLTFVVEPNGRATNIQVVESLHPLCDSAAVRALRRTRFVPGRQDGQRVPVRMRLPVRFEIIDSPIATSGPEAQ